MSISYGLLGLLFYNIPEDTENKLKNGMLFFF